MVTHALACKADKIANNADNICLHAIVTVTRPLACKADKKAGWKPIQSIIVK